MNSIFACYIKISKQNISFNRKFNNNDIKLSKYNKSLNCKFNNNATYLTSGLCLSN